MAKRSRNKGNAFERKVAKLIITAAGEGFSNKDCYRTPLSGGHPFAGSSDLVMRKRLRRIAPFCVECKHYKGWKLEHMFRLTSVVKGWHKQVLLAVEADRYKRMPLLVVRGYGGLIFASAPLWAWVDWMQDGKGVLPTIRLDYKYQKEVWCVVNFKAVLRTITRKAERARCTT